MGTTSYKRDKKEYDVRFGSASLVPTYDTSKACTYENNPRFIATGCQKVHFLQLENANKSLFQRAMYVVIDPSVECSILYHC